MWFTNYSFIVSEVLMLMLQASFNFLLDIFFLKWKFSFFFPRINSFPEPVSFKCSSSVTSRHQKLYPPVIWLPPRRLSKFMLLQHYATDLCYRKSYRRVNITRKNSLNLFHFSKAAVIHWTIAAFQTCSKHSQSVIWFIKLRNCLPLLLISNLNVWMLAQH